ncbi:MAG TPA: Fic family protein [Chitinophagaceae bacterium]|nr:Fic family protein [Chitinophagaceae bacterium]
MTYNWQQKDWPDFKFETLEIEEELLAIAQEMGHVSGVLTALPDNVQTETLLNIMVSEAIKTSAIEGEFLSRPDVMSSIKNKLGLNAEKLPVHDKKAQGAGELMVAVRDSYEESLTEEMLFAWHKMLLRQSSRIAVGEWRSHPEPMQVVSGPIGKEKVHFEAPPLSKVPEEMKRFINWFNDTAPGAKNEIKKAPIRSAIAYLYFETIHPFEDGNGRIGRAIAEKALSQTIGRPVMLSLSQAIESDKNAYYDALKAAQQKNEITDWVKYFVHVIYNAQIAAKELIDFTLKKVKFLDRYREKLNQRQLKVVLRMLESPDGFEGGMTARKYVSVTKTSKATATRDLQELVDLGILISEGGGRSVHYYIRLD